MSGTYRECACPNCFEITVGDTARPEFCDDCMRGRCGSGGECSSYDDHVFAQRMKRKCDTCQHRLVDCEARQPGTCYAVVWS
jgi:hypothetical protein